MSKKILIVSGHTDLKNNSSANKIILDRLKELMPGTGADFTCGMGRNDDKKLKQMKNKNKAFEHAERVFEKIRSL